VRSEIAAYEADLGTLTLFGFFPPSLWSVCASNVYSGLGADIVTLTTGFLV
jgi:hypothetical protein